MRRHTTTHFVPLTVVAALICLPIIACEKADEGPVNKGHATTPQATQSQHVESPEHAHEDHSDHDHNDHNHAGHIHDEIAETPDTYAEAIAELSRELADIQDHLSHDHGDEVDQGCCDRLIGLCGNLTKLAMKPGSGVERSRVKLVNKTSKTLSAIAQRMHDSDQKIAPTDIAALHGKMVELHKTLASCTTIPAKSKERNGETALFPQQDDHQHHDHDHSHEGEENSGHHDHEHDH